MKINKVLMFATSMAIISSSLNAMQNKENNDEYLFNIFNNNNNINMSETIANNNITEKDIEDLKKNLQNNNINDKNINISNPILPPMFNIMQFSQNPLMNGFSNIPNGFSNTQINSFLNPSANLGPTPIEIYIINQFNSIIKTQNIMQQQLNQINKKLSNICQQVNNNKGSIPDKILELSKKLDYTKNKSNVNKKNNKNNNNNKNDNINNSIQEDKKDNAHDSNNKYNNNSQWQYIEQGKKSKRKPK